MSDNKVHEADEKKAERYGKRRIENDPSTFEFKGLCGAPHTPMTPDLQVNISAIRSLFNRYINNGITGAFINGTTGEGVSLSFEERKLIQEEWAKIVKEEKESRNLNFTIISHVGCESLSEVVDLARHAQSVGISAIAVTPPCYYKPSNLDGLVDWLKAIGDALPDLPIYYYHFSDMNGVNFPVHHLLQRCIGRARTVCGCKFTSYNLYEYERSILVDDHHFNLLIGREEILIGALMFGCVGGIGATYGFLGNVFSEILDLFAADKTKEASELQHKANNVILILNSSSKYGEGVGFMEISKAVLKLTGIDAGPCRLPRKRISEDKLALLKSDLEALDFFKWCAK